MQMCCEPGTDTALFKGKISERSAYFESYRTVAPVTMATCLSLGGLGVIVAIASPRLFQSEIRKIG